jgi:CRISPR/Cas system-associated exonuclease Cas4 (RecB family)
MAYYKRDTSYNIGQTKPYVISRSKIELFTQCKRCFWLEAISGIKRPSSPPFQINKAIDELFKKEFDAYRKNQLPHPIMTENNLDAVPFAHDQIDTWRDTFKGIRTLHKDTNLEVFGGIDDVWVDSNDNLIVVDYKATAKAKEVNLDADWQQSYKRQLEVYQWLLRQNGFKVSDTGYFVYANAKFDGDNFNDTLKFTTKLIAHSGSDKWIEPTLVQIKETLEGSIPQTGDSIMGGECEFCSYARARTQLALNHIQKSNK